MSPVPIDDVGKAVVDPDPAPEVAGTGTGETMSRADAIDAVAAALVAEGNPPVTSRVLATIYMTSDELSKMLATLDQLGGVPGVGGIVRAMFSRKGRRDDDR